MYTSHWSARHAFRKSDTAIPAYCHLVVKTMKFWHISAKDKEIIINVGRTGMFIFSTAAGKPSELNAGIKTLLQNADEKVQY